MGNFSRNTFDELKHYVSVRLQQGVPIVDADWNEMDDIRRYELRSFLRKFVGDGVPEGNDGFRIEAVGTEQTGIAIKDFTIKRGHCLVDGMEVINNIIITEKLLTGELIKIKRDIKYTEQALFKDPSLAKRWGVDPLPPLKLLVGKIYIAYLDVWERGVGAEEESALINESIGIETCVRLKREWVVRVTEVAEEMTLREPPDGHAFYSLAKLEHRRLQISGMAITDLRRTELSLAALLDEVVDARGKKAKLGNRFDSTVRIHRVPLLRQTLFGVGTTVPVGKNPHGIAFDGTHMWVTNEVSNNVSKILA